MNAKQHEFIELRAQGLSLRKIAEQINVGRDTCAKWEKDLVKNVQQRRGEVLEEITALYGANREARVKRLSDTLKKIDLRLAEINLEAVPADKLLRLKLEYEKLLKAEEIEQFTGFELGTGDSESILAVCAQIFREQANGAISSATAAGLFKSLNMITGAVKAVEDVDPLGNLFANEMEL